MTGADRLQQDFEAEIAKLSEDDQVLWMRYTANVRLYKSGRGLYTTVQWQRYPISRANRVAIYQRGHQWQLWFGSETMVHYTGDRTSIAQMAIDAIRERWLPSVETKRLIT